MIFGGIGVALAAPYYTFTKTIVPESNNGFDIGTSTAVYRNAYITNLCLSADCKTAWPAGGSSSNTVSTSTVPTIGQLSYWTSNGFPSLLGSVATTSVTCSGGSSCSTFNVLGSSPVSISSFSYPFPSNATSTLIDFSGGVKIATLSGLIAGNSGTLYQVSTTSMNASITGLAGTATALATPRAINGVNFDGTAPITITAASSTLLTDQNIFSVGTTTMVNGHYTGNLQVDGKFFAPVTMVASGDTTINGALTVTGATTLATSLTGLLKASSGLVSVASAGSDYENPLTFSFPLIRSANAISFGGLSTSTAAIIGNIPYFSGVNTFANVATSTATLGLGLSGTLTTINNTAQSLTIATSSLYSGTTGQFPYFSGTNTLTGTSNIFSTAAGLIGISSSTPTYSLSVGTGASAFYISTSTGEIVGYDATNAWQGRISPTHNLILSTATTTAWTASTSAPYINTVVMPFAGTIRTAKCTTDAGTLNVDIYHTTTHLVLLNASTTVGTFTWTTNNTVTAGEKLYMAAGTPASSPTLVSCTLGITETP